MVAMIGDFIDFGVAILVSKESIRMFIYFFMHEIVDDAIHTYRQYRTSYKCVSVLVSIVCLSLGLKELPQMGPSRSDAYPELRTS